MITRGYFIGQIIDELTAISHQVKARAGLQLYDINRYLEDFFKDILNIILDLKLINLNDERSNNPGLDLGDKEKGIAFQVTSTKTREKVNNTLEKAASQKDLFPTIFILILQEKQNQYTLKEELTKPFNFNEKEHIWDINNILKEVMPLPIERLQNLYELVSKEVARVKIELEIPDKDGNYQTNINSYIEQIPREQFKGITNYYGFLNKESQYEKTLKEVDEDFKKFIKTLKKLPRITRQFYTFILERGEWDETNRFINFDYLNRICNFPDKEGELRLLQGAGLCYLQEPHSREDCSTIQIEMVPDAKSIEFTWEFLDYIKEKNISLDKVIVSLDFSDFN